MIILAQALYFLGFHTLNVCYEHTILLLYATFAHMQIQQGLEGPRIESLGQECKRNPGS